MYLTSHGQVALLLCGNDLRDCAALAHAMFIPDEVVFTPSPACSLLACCVHASQVSLSEDPLPMRTPVAPEIRSQRYNPLLTNSANETIREMIQ